MNEQYKRLRKHLNPAVKGKFTDALLKAIAEGDKLTDSNVLALKSNLFLATASKQYLKKILAGIGFNIPVGVGIDDENLRNIAIATTNSKTTQNIFLEVLELFYGEDAVKAYTISTLAEPFNLSDGQDLYIVQDGFDAPLRVEFSANDFANIASAKAIEVASVISKAAVQNGYTLYATPYLDATSNQTFVQIFSGTRGTKSLIQIIGGSAQNSLRFPLLRATTQTAGTQFTVSFSGDTVRYTWSGGPSPSLQNIQVGDYVTISSPPFPVEHKGSFTITAVVPDVVGVGYFEIVNPLVQTTGTYTLANANQMRFFFPKRNTLFDLIRKATLFQVNPYEVVIFLPATSRIVKRQLQGGWHIHDTSFNSDYLGSYLFNPKSGFAISSISQTLNQQIDAGNVYSVIECAGSTELFPNDVGFLVFGFGTSNQEAPVRYFSRPSSNTLLIDSSYVFKKTHPIGTDVALIRQTRPYKPKTDGTDYPTYLTGTTRGRIEAENLAKRIAAAGIFLNIIIVYPEGPGLNNIEDVYAADIL